MLAIALHRRGQLQLDDRLKGRLPRLVLATLAMGIALWFAAPLLASLYQLGEGMRIGATALLVLGGGSVFGLAAQLFGALRLSELKPLMRGSSQGG
jgi:putative peptidoglycan lipid II flippase